MCRPNRHPRPLAHTSRHTTEPPNTVPVRPPHRSTEISEDREREPGAGNEMVRILPSSRMQRGPPPRWLEAVHGPP